MHTLGRRASRPQQWCTKLSWRQATHSCPCAHGAATKQDTTVRAGAHQSNDRDVFATEAPGTIHEGACHLTAWWGCGMPLCLNCDNAMHGCMDCYCRKGDTLPAEAAKTHFFCMTMPADKVMQTPALPDCPFDVTLVQKQGAVHATRTM